MAIFTSKLLRTCLGLLLASALLGLVFNLVMPQGIGLMPPELTAPRWQPVSVAQAKELVDQGALLVDARDSSDYKLGHFQGAVNLSPREFGLLYPLLRQQIQAAPRVVVFGRTFSRFPAARVAQELSARGLDQVLVVQAGCQEMQAAGFVRREPRRRARP